jgi:hypothetical protein
VREVREGLTTRQTLQTSIVAPVVELYITRQISISLKPSDGQLLVISEHQEPIPRVGLLKEPYALCNHRKLGRRQTITAYWSCPSSDDLRQMLA